jgi:phosphoglycerate dehydrogenase-like enzyme
MIGKAEIAQMKPNAILINTARGQIVDEAALAEALRERKLSGAGIDVFHTEHTIDPDNPLIGLENVMLSPHIASQTRSGVTRSIVQFTTNIARVLDDKEPLYIVS